jgi:hypothetical protein
MEINFWKLDPFDSDWRSHRLLLTAQSAERRSPQAIARDENGIGARRADPYHSLSRRGGEGGVAQSRNP